LEDISFYFTPLLFTPSEHSESNCIASEIDVHTKEHFPELSKGSIAIIYIPEFRGSICEFERPEKFRQRLYALHPAHSWTTKLIDLGNVRLGQTLEDTYFALSEIVTNLVKKQIIPCVIGGSADLTLAIYRGYARLEQFVNLCSVSSSLDIGSPSSTNGYIRDILFQRPCYLFNLANLGVQIPLVEKEELDLFDKLYFDICRLGELTTDFKRVEPHLRNSDIVSVDLRSVRYADLHDPQYTNPNGFYAEQMCQIARYAGISDKLSSWGIFNYFPEQTQAYNISELIAQMLWYFIDGVNSRMGDFPIGTRKNYTQFIVHTGLENEDIIFYKSNKTARWWMEVPYPAMKNKKYERHYLVPCNYEDYKKAMQNEIPDLWWKTYQKLV